MDYKTFAISYNLLILVFSFWSSISGPDMNFAASSRDITFFQETNNSINCWQSNPSDFSRL